MGHASRMAALAERLVASGNEVMFSSSGEVTKWLRAKGYNCNDVPLVDVVFTDSGSFSAKETMKFFPIINARMSRQVVKEIGNLARFAPDVTLSDSMVSTVVASKFLGIRSVALLNLRGGGERKGGGGSSGRSRVRRAPEARSSRRPSRPRRPSGRSTSS